MAKAKLFGGRRSSAQTVQLIDPNVARSSKRRAKKSFWVTAILLGLLAAWIASADMHVILAVIVGALVGAVVGAVVAGVVLAWPMLRIVWHWAIEITVGGFLVWSLTALADWTSGPIAIGSYAVVGVAVYLIRPARRAVVAVSWCVVSRHRLRVSFSSFLKGAGDGSVPLILWAMPTPVGERVWIWLRPGLSIADLRDRCEKLAVACWADEVTVVRSNEKNAAMLRCDIKRRNTLKGIVSSPLVNVPEAPGRAMPTVGDVTALDLPDVPAESVADSALTKPVKSTGKKTIPSPRPAIETAGDDFDGLSEYI